MDHPRLNVANTRERALSRDRERTRSPNSCMHVRRIVRRISTAFAVSSINVIRQVAQSRLNDGRKRGSLYSSVDFFFFRTALWPPPTSSSSSLPSCSPYSFHDTSSLTLHPRRVISEAHPGLPAYFALSAVNYQRLCERHTSEVEVVSCLTECRSFFADLS